MLRGYRQIREWNSAQLLVGDNYGKFIVEEKLEVGL
jgi:hypothetical protein